MEKIGVEEPTNEDLVDQMRHILEDFASQSKAFCIEMNARNRNLLAVSYNIHLSEKDLLNEIVNPFSGEQYPNFPKTLHEVRDWNVLEISSMNFLECDPCIPRPETDQGMEQAIREIKRMVGLPLDDPKSATTIHASNQSADKALHTTTFTGKPPKSSTNKIRSGRIAKLPSSKQRLSPKPRRG